VVRKSQDPAGRNQVFYVVILSFSHENMKLEIQ
jgi:hypothetical protein